MLKDIILIYTVHVELMKRWMKIFSRETIGIDIAELLYSIISQSFIGELLKLIAIVFWFYCLNTCWFTFASKGCFVIDQVKRECHKLKKMGNIIKDYET